MSSAEPVVAYDPDWDDDDPRHQDPNGPLPQSDEHAVAPARPAQQVRESVVDDNVFDLDEEVKPVVLRGMSRYGIAQDTVMDEPTGGQIRAFRRAFWEVGRANRPDREMPEDPTEEQIDELISSRDWGENVSALEVDAFALLCGATPPPTHRPQPPARPEKTEPKIAKGANQQARTAAVRKHERDHQAAVEKWEKDLVKHREQVEQWEAKWSGGIPTRDQLARLPFRAQARLFGYLIGKFTDPFGAGADTKD